MCTFYDHISIVMFFRFSMLTMFAIVWYLKLTQKYLKIIEERFINTKIWFTKNVGALFE